jgi:hypothetical protein
MEDHHILRFLSIAVGGSGVKEKHSSFHEVPILLHVGFLAVGWTKEEVTQSQQRKLNEIKKKIQILLTT